MIFFLLTHTIASMKQFVVDKCCGMINRDLRKFVKKQCLPNFFPEGFVLSCRWHETRTSDLEKKSP